MYKEKAVGIITDFQINFCIASILAVTYFIGPIPFISCMAIIMIVAMIFAMSLASMTLYYSLTPPIIDDLRERFLADKEFVAMTQLSVVMTRGIDFIACAVASIFAMICGYQMIGICYLVSAGAMNLISATLDDKIRSRRK